MFNINLFSSKARQAPSAESFARDLRHLDGTCSREVHKVAVIYVAKGQEVIFRIYLKNLNLSIYTICLLELIR
jgi:hypothetical protein